MRKRRDTTNRAQWTEEEEDRLRKNVRKNVINTAEQHPETTFYYYIPPYSVMVWGNLYKNGELIYNYDQMKEMNKKYSSVLKDHEIKIEKEYELNEKENDILYIETLPLLIADFIQENPKYNIINTELNDNELNKEIKNLFDGDILKKLERNNRNLKRQVNCAYFCACTH